MPCRCAVDQRAILPRVQEVPINSEPVAGAKLNGVGILTLGRDKCNHHYQKWENPKKTTPDSDKNEICSCNHRNPMIVCRQRLYLT